MLFGVLRFLHIVAGILWAGGSVMMYFFIAPTMRSIGDSGKQFAGHLMGKTRFTLFMTVVGLVNVLAGVVLYGIDAQWFQSGWMRTGTGIAFGLGAAAGILAFIFGGLFGSANSAMAALSAQIQGKPTEEQMSKMQAIMKRQAMMSRLNVVFIIITITLMESARMFG